ncbi:helix-turn-helix transcriptional regulator [Nocardioides mesophilus]|uniref:AAA family ATPase n=1 Tax=Nocardioides mesophilus TaxID=433659 RepID=A0A7G9R905_9ACTN|nr:helix-turn-helix transcriptional regulator [Nocardioides mesophilus]QNN52080.1 AAA family ATPase [Nocardioides mesophilus]
MVRLRTADLIARDAELSELGAAVDAARAGLRGAVLVCGPPGVGKSRLVEEAVRRGRREGDLVLVGHCVDLYGEEIPYAAVAEALRHLVRERGPGGARQMLGPAARPLAALVPDLDTGDYRRAASEADVDRSGGVHVLDAFVAGLDRAGRGTGRVIWLWLEDLQWADRATRNLVSYLLRVEGPPNLVMMATVRTEDTASPGADDVIAELLRVPLVDQIVLQPFTRSQVAEHLRALTGLRSGAGVVHTVALLSGGLPFYTELLAREGLPDGRVPSPVRSMVRGEIESLDDDARATVEAASVESGRLPHDVLVAVAGGEHRALAGIATAVAESVLVPEPDGSGYRFRHALLRESVEAGLLPGDRRRWHERWAKQLEMSAESTGDPFARIAAAHHWAGAGDNSRALDAVLTGAALAHQVLADAEAVGLLARALELWPSVPDATQRAGIEQDALLRSSLFWARMAGRSDLAETLGAVRLTGGQNQVRDLSIAYTRREFDGVDWQPTGAEVQLLRSCPLSNPWLSRAAGDASFALQETDPQSASVLADRAVQAAELAVQVYRESGRHRTALTWITPEEELLYAEHCRADVMLCVAGRAEEAARFYANLRPRCEAVSPQVGLECDACMAEALAATGKHQDAYATANAALAALPQPRKSLQLYATFTHTAADSEIALGDWDHALSRLDEACQDVDDDSLTYSLCALAGLLHCWRGNLRTAERCATTVRSHLDTVDSTSWRAVWETIWLEAELAVARSHAARARTILGTLWSKPHPESASHAMWRPLMSAVKVNVDEIAGRPARSTKEARDDLATCQVVAARLHRIGDVGVAWDLHLTAELSRLDRPSDPAPWAAAAEAWIAAGWLRERCLALLGLATAQARSGCNKEARDALQSARDIAHQLGAAPLEVATVQIARNTGLGPAAGSGRAPGATGLTAREMEVLALITRGYSNNRIATELFISPKTASVHVSNILGKLHASSRTEAAAIAQRTNVLDR